MRNGVDDLLAEADGFINEDYPTNADIVARNKNGSQISSVNGSIEDSKSKKKKKKKKIVIDDEDETPRKAKNGKTNFEPVQDDNSQELNFIKNSDKSQDLPLLNLDHINAQSQRSNNGNVMPNFEDNKPRKSNRRQQIDNLDTDSDDQDILRTMETQGDLSFQDTSGQMVAYKPNPRLKNYKGIFQDLLKQTTVKLLNPIVSMIISADSTRALALTKKDDTTYLITQYCLENYEETFKETIGGFKGDFIKCKDIEQHNSGNLFAIAYNNDGVFKVRIFGKQKRDVVDIEADEINVNQLIGLNNYTMCNQTSFDPFINVVFIDDDKLYICVFQNIKRTHWHFFYSISQRKIVGKPVSMVMECSKKNHPQRSFYNSEAREVYTIYRQSEAFIIQEDDPEDYRFDETITDEPGVAMGQMYLVFNKALIVSCSNDILFFKIEHSVETDNREFKIYQSILKVGQNTIYFINGNIRIQIVTSEKIYYYLIDRQTLRAELQYVMFNYMKCSQIMIGPKVRYAITYKTNEQSFELYRRKYAHDFKIPVITKENLEGAICMDMPSINSFIVAKLDQVRFYNNETFKVREDVNLPIKLMKADTREPNQVITMSKNHKEDLLAVITGKVLIMNEQKMNQLYIFKRKFVNFSDCDSEEQFDLDRSGFQFEQISWCAIREIEIFEKGVCADFHFFETNEKEIDKLIFCKKDKVFTYNFMTKKTKVIYKIKTPLSRQPLEFEPNEDQTIFMIASPQDGIHINLNETKENQFYDFQVDFELSQIRSITYELDEKYYYIIANKYQEKLGFFVLKVKADDPTCGVFLVKWKNKLDIAACCMHILKYPDMGYSELVMGFKSIFVNVYNLFCIDISQEGVENIIFRHESFQLWESDCSGVLLRNKSSDFVTLNKHGMWVTSFGANQTSEEDKGLNRKRIIVDDCGQERMLHSLESCNYLQLEKDNYIHMDCQNQDSKVISIRQEYTKGTTSASGDPEMGEEVLFNINLQPLNLRELLLCQSLSMCKTMSDIFEFVQDQPSPEIFFKSTFEFDFANLVSILSFDSRSIEYLLSEDHHEYFSTIKYPLFYRNKIQKGPRKLGRFFYRSAIDSALRNNQTASVESIIKYIVKHQNDIVSSWLFRHNIPQLCETGISLEELLDSNVFKKTIDFDEWPSVHTSDQELMRGYSFNIFEIRKHYRDIFHEDEFKPMNTEEGSQVNKVNKIKYQIILLPIIGSHYQQQVDSYSKQMEQQFEKDDIFTTGVFSEADDIDIFRSENVQDFIDFKWQTYGFNFHLISTIIQMAYLAMLFIYVNNNYIEYQPDKGSNWTAFLIIVFVAYPCTLETMQVIKVGVIDYISDHDNWLDITFIYGSVAMAIVQYANGPQHFASKMLIVIVLLAAFRQTLKLLRIFSSLSTLIAMLTSVIWQLRIFMTFFILLLIFFASMFSVLGTCNVKHDGSFRMVFYSKDDINNLSPDAPNFAYRKISLFYANIIQMFRISMGDFAVIDCIKFVNKQEDVVVFWILWFIMVIILAVIFLNFVVAEATETYNQVNESIVEFIYQQKADLIADAESIMPNSVKKVEHFPQFIVQRKIET